MNHLKTGNAYFGRGSYKDYKYNGHELQETGMYDYGARLYMSDIARWGVIDPLMEQTDQSYSYGNNNPVNFIDFMGMLALPPEDPNAYDVGDIYTDSDGSWKRVEGGWEAVTEGQTNIVDEIVLPAPAAASPPIMPFNCGACFYNGGGMAITLSQPNPSPGAADAIYQNRPPEPGGGGVVMMDSMWDVLGIVIANNIEPETQTQAFGLAALAIVLTKGKAAPGIVKAEIAMETASIKAEGKIIGLGIDADLALHRGSGAIIYEYGGWQKAGLTNVDWGKASIDKYHFKSSFWEAAEKASGIRFEVTNFNPFYHKPGITNFEFNHILNDPSLLQKTTFIQNGNQVIWNGTQFIK